MQTFVKIQIRKAGFCYQIEKVVLRDGKFRSVRFPSTFALIEHPKKGYILFDTGYSSHVVEGSKNFPMNLYPIITPIDFKDEDSAANQLQAIGIDPSSIKLIIISHFHIDHIGGLRDFPEAKFMFTRSGGKSIKNMSGFKALSCAFMPELIPDDFWQRSIFIEDEGTPPDALEYPEFTNGYDLLGDGSLVAVKLLGHAVGQIGLFVKTKDHIILLAADACWKSRAFRDLISPHPLTRMILGQKVESSKTLHKLHRLHYARPDIKIIPTHCEEALNALNQATKD